MTRLHVLFLLVASFPEVAQTGNIPNATYTDESVQNLTDHLSTSTAPFHEGLQAQQIIMNNPNATNGNASTLNVTNQHSFSISAHSHRRHDGHRGCGTHDPSDEDLHEMTLELEQWETNQTMALGNFSSNITTRVRSLLEKQYTIPVFFSVLALSETEGTMTDGNLRTIIRILNQAYQNTSFHFALQGIQRRTGIFWHNCTINNEDQWKGPLYIRGTNALNIYICNPSFYASTGPVPSQGYSTWPTAANSIVDGVTIPHRMYYGGTPYYAVHEVGHFLGLLHTFQGACTSRERVFEGMALTDGDGVDDTPAHASQTLDIEQGRETCWKNLTIDTCNDSRDPKIDPGLDPVSNYMNFIPPKCWAQYGEFTPGQNLRMLALFEQFRLSNPWRCKKAGLSCRETFECCGASTCVTATNRTFGRCTSPAPVCKPAGNACSRTSECCNGLTCSASVCRVPAAPTLRPTTPPSPSTPTRPQRPTRLPMSPMTPRPQMGPSECISILCRTAPNRMRMMMTMMMMMRS